MVIEKKRVKDSQWTLLPYLWVITDWGGKDSGVILSVRALTQQRGDGPQMVWSVD